MESRGFAEADVGRDLNGEDRADRIRILARHAFGTKYDGRPGTCEGLPALIGQRLATARDRGDVLRLVATFEARGQAAVRLETLPADDYLAGARREESRLVVTGAGGREWRVSGKGAGRWPTAEAVAT